MKNNFSVVPEVLTRNPVMARILAGSFIKKKKAAIIDRNLHPGISNIMSLLTFRITPLCNLRCVMCNQRGETGVLKGSYAVEESKKLVPIERYKELIDEVSPHKPLFYIWGGEPFMYPDIMEFCRYVVEKGNVLSVNTNGTFLKARAEQIVKDKWNALFVSLDGFEDVNDTIRGKGSYRRVIEGFEEINRQKKLQGSNLPFMGVVTTVSNLNYKYLDKLTEAAKDFGLAWHIINLGTYTNRGIIDKHTAFMKEHLDTDIHCLEGFANGYNEGIDGELFSEVLERVHAMENGYPIITVPAIRPGKIGTYYSTLEEPVRDQCSIPWFQGNIDYNGDVYFCSDYPDYVLGNIMKESSFYDIYNNEKAQKFRKVLKESKDGLMPGCVRCYQNMLFGKTIKGY
jgi:radical SAM protein with 4Fe4S-binding SPASM domain